MTQFLLLFCLNLTLISLLLHVKNKSLQVLFLLSTKKRTRMKKCPQAPTLDESVFLISQTQPVCFACRANNADLQEPQPPRRFNSGQCSGLSTSEQRIVSSLSVDCSCLCLLILHYVTKNTSTMTCLYLLYCKKKVKRLQE